MISVTLGEYALAGAMLTALAVVMGAVGFGMTKNEGLLRGVRAGMGLTAALLTVSVWGLLQALIHDNFAVDYVARHSEQALPLGYKIAAFWAGQEGSLLLWAWLIAVMGALLAWRLRRKDDAQSAVTLAAMAAVTGFFICVMLFASNDDVSGNPFLAAKPGSQVEGLNPVLQNWMMVLHPPMLFLGYAAFTVPFALLMGALATGRENGWLKEGRGWMVFAWVALTVGIILGSQWAYMVLGWGGYWGWDPVENASLLPWLTGTALLHSAVMQAHRGVFKRWTAFLTAASFFLCIFGTYLTRSGVVQSVHTFGDSPIGTFFLVMLILTGCISALAILCRLAMLKGDRPLDELISREGMVLGGNVLLVVMTLVVIIGTMFEKISGTFGSASVTLSGGFYNKVVLPMAVLLAVMMATGPVLGFGAGALDRAMKKLLGMAVVGVIAALVAGAIGNWNAWAMIVAWTAGAVFTGVAIDLAIGINTSPSVLRSLIGRLRHWGAQVAHVGLAILVVGVMGSSLYAVKQEKSEALMLKAGAEAQRVGQYLVQLQGVEQVRRDNHDALVARVLVTQDGKGSFEMKPERRVYDHGMRPGQSSSEVAIRFGVLSDVYLNFAGMDSDTGNAAMEVFINPLVNWIWVGAGLMVLGGLMCLGAAARESGTQKLATEVVSEKPAEIRSTGTARERRRAKESGNVAFVGSER